jgi:hypothetical protein
MNRIRRDGSLERFRTGTVTAQRSLEWVVTEEQANSIELVANGQGSWQARPVTVNRGIRDQGAALQPAIRMFFPRLHSLLGADASDALGQAMGENAQQRRYCGLAGTARRSPQTPRSCRNRR